MILGEVVRKLLGPIRKNISINYFNHSKERYGIDVWNGTVYIRLNECYQLSGKPPMKEIDRTLDGFFNNIDNYIDYCATIMTQPRRNDIISWYLFYSKDETLSIGQTKPHIKRIESWDSPYPPSRKDGPAYVFYDVDGSFLREEYWIDNVSLTEKFGITCLEEFQNHFLLL